MTPRQWFVLLVLGGAILLAVLISATFLLYCLRKQRPKEATDGISFYPFGQEQGLEKYAKSEGYALKYKGWAWGTDQGSYVAANFQLHTVRKLSVKIVLHAHSMSALITAIKRAEESGVVYGEPLT